MYGLSHNRQKPLGGVVNAAVFNTFRRTRQQILYWATPMIAGYSLMHWAIERWVFVNFWADCADFLFVEFLGSGGWKG